MAIPQHIILSGTWELLASAVGASLRVTMTPARGGRIDWVIANQIPGAQDTEGHDGHVAILLDGESLYIKSGSGLNMAYTLEEFGDQEFFVMSGAAHIIPVSTASFETLLMPVRLNMGTGGIAFYNSATPGSPLVTPSSGTFKFSAQFMDGQWQDASNGAEINANLAGPAGGYTLPKFDGHVLRMRVTLANVIGATHFSAKTVRYTATTM